MRKRKKPDRRDRRRSFRIPAAVLALLCWCCMGRAEFTLPESLTEIGEEAFAGCGAVNAVNVPESVETVGGDAFSECGEALLIITGAAGEAVLNYARANQVDYRAGTHCRALVIGQTYEGTSVSRLVGPANDLYAMQTRLEQTGWTVAAKKNLTTNGILSCIGSTFYGATEEDISLLYFSGHGWPDGSLVGTNNKGVTPNELKSALDAIPGRKVIIVDTCYSGKLIEEENGQSGTTLRGAIAAAEAEEKTVTIEKAAAEMEETGAEEETAGAEEETVTAEEEAGAEAFIDSFQAAFRPRLRGALNANNYFVITAARPNEQSDEEEFSESGYRRVMGVFTHFFCLGIGYNGVTRQTTGLNADGNGDGAVSIQEVYAYASVNATTRYQYQHAMVWPSGCRWFAPFRP